MRQLTSLDAQFLALEDDRQRGHVGSLGIYDASTAPSGDLTAADLRALIAQRMPSLPPLSWKLAQVPLNLDYPYWVLEPDVDLTFHVREAALPSPGSDAQLATLIARLHERALDRSRPLWELTVISGLESGHVAVYSKIHHALIDGVSGAEIVGMLLDLTPEVQDAPPLAPASTEPLGTAPGTLSMLGRGLLGMGRHPLRRVRALPATVAHLDESQLANVPGVATVGRLAGRVDRLVRRDSERIVRPALDAPVVPFSTRVTAQRSFAFGRMDLDRVKQVKKAQGVTLNDVVVALCAGAVRRWLIEHEALPEGPLVAQVPVSVRTPDQVMTYGNRILLLAAALHTEVPDPAERLRRTSEDLTIMKTRHSALPAQLLTDVNHFIPAALFNRAARMSLSMAARGFLRTNWNLVISNVPGPQFDLYCAGAKLLANYPVSAITDGLGLNITVMSYAGHFDIGILADRAQVPDVDQLLAWMEEELAVLEGLPG